MKLSEYLYIHWPALGSNVWTRSNRAHRIKSFFRRKKGKVTEMSQQKYLLILPGFTQSFVYSGEKEDIACERYTLTKLILVWGEGFIKASNPQRKG